MPGLRKTEQCSSCKVSTNVKKKEEEVEFKELQKIIFS